VKRIFLIKGGEKRSQPPRLEKTRMGRALPNVSRKASGGKIKKSPHRESCRGRNVKTMGGKIKLAKELDQCRGRGKTT